MAACHSTPSAATEAVRMLERPGHFGRCDVSRLDDIGECVHATQERVGEIGLLVNDACLATACSATDDAYGLLFTGEADIVLADGSDSVCRGAHADFSRLGAPRIYPDILACGVNRGADHPVAPKQADVTRCMRTAMIDHTMGAGSGFGAIAAVIAIDQGFLNDAIVMLGVA